MNYELFSFSIRESLSISNVLKCFFSTFWWPWNVCCSQPPPNTCISLHSEWLWYDSGTGKRIEALAKKKDYALVKKWKKSIINHIFWCVSSTNDDEPDLKETKWLSITKHLMNRHSGHENQLFPKCVHGRLHGRERRKKWLKPST